MPSIRPDAKISDWSAPEAPTPGASAPRVRFSPVWMTAAIALAGGLVLYIAFPQRTLDWYMAKNERNDPVLTLLLRAYQRLEPDNVAIRIAYLRQLMAEGRWGEAERALGPLLASSDRPTHIAALMLEFELVERQVMSLAPDTPAREQATSRLQALLESMHREGIQAGDLSRNVRRLLAADREAQEEAQAQRIAQVQHALAVRRAEETGTPFDAPTAAVAKTAPVIAAAPPKPPATPVDEARRRLAEGNHVGAAQAYLRAMQDARPYELKRRHFLDAMRTYQAASRFNEAFAAAEAQGQPFMRDIVVVEFLVRLGRAGNRPDMAERYVRMMLRLSSFDAGEAVARSRATDRESPAARHFAERMMEWLVPSAYAAEEDLIISLPFDEERYLLAFEVFLASKNQGAARKVAAEAVRRVPDNAIWRKRYAQVSEWDGQAHLALSQWIAYAEITDSDEGWSAVKRLAAPLFEPEAELKWLAREYRRRPGDLKILIAMVDAHERLGTTDEAIALLQAERRKHAAREIPFMLAELAQRVGKDDVALDAYENVVERFGPAIDIAIRQAVIAYTLRRPDEAWRYVRRAESKAGTNDFEYWRVYATLATLTGQFDEAAKALRMVVGQSVAETRDFFDLIGVLSGRYPVEAAAVAEQGYERFGRIEWLLLALQTHSDLRDWTSFKRVLGKATESDLATLGRSPGFLILRAAYYQATGAETAALRELSSALALSPRDKEVRQQVMWLLLAMRRPDLLRVVTARWHKDAEAIESMWAPFAAAYMTLGEPRMAIRFYHRLVERKSDDYLLLLSYAAALDQEGDRERAWRIRRHAWTNMRRPEALAAVKDQRRAQELKRAFAQLAISFASADDSARLIGELLYGTTPDDSAAKELALSWMVAVDAPDAAHAWYLQHYARDLASAKERPYWAMLAVALADDDRPALAKLLEDQADLLPLSDRMEANLRLGRIRQATALSHEHLTRFPDRSDAHERFAALVLDDGRRATTELKHARIGPLRSIGAAARLNYDFDQIMRLTLGVEQRNQSTRDTAVLAAVPARDRTVEAGARFRLPAGNTSVAITRRQSLASHTGLRLDWAKESGRWSASASTGSKQPAVETSPLRLGGVKDTFEATVAYRLGKYDTVSAVVRADRFKSQNGTRLGAGRIAAAEYSHALRLEYPDVRARAFISRNTYSMSGLMDPAFAKFMPDGSIPPSELVIPKSHLLRGIALSAGTAYERRYSRAWRPFGDVAIVKNSAFGRGTITRIGIAGTLFGGDEMSIYMNYSRAARGSNDITREIGIRYAW